MLNISEFLVVLVETTDLFTNFDVKYRWAYNCGALVSGRFWYVTALCI